MSLRQATAGAAACEAVAGLGAIALGMADQPRTALFLGALVLPSILLTAATAYLAAAGLMGGNIRTGRLVALQLLWLGWAETFGQGIDGGTFANLFLGAFVVSASAVVVSAAAASLTEPPQP